MGLTSFPIFMSQSSTSITEDLASPRIKRFRSRFLHEIPTISIQRAKFYTEMWQNTENQNILPVKRVALCMKHVYEHIDLHIDPDDRVVGSWTENFLGIPIDIERGLYNKVLEVEFDKRKMRWFSLKGNINFALTQIKRHELKNLLHNLREAKETGVAMPDLGTDTMDKRRINPYRIQQADKTFLHTKLLPYWKSKTIAEMLDRAFWDEHIYRGGWGDFISTLPRTTAATDMITSAGAALGVWQGHLILDHETPLKKGILQMQAEVRQILSSDTSLIRDQREFLEAIDLAYEGVLIYTQRLREKVKIFRDQTTDPVLKSEFDRIYAILQRVPMYPAESFQEALQSYWIIKTAVELAVPFNVHAPGRLDQLLYPYYQQDLERKQITMEDAREFLEELFLKIMSHNMRPYSNASSQFSQRYEGSEPVTLGGLTSTGEDATNSLTYLMLEAADRSKASLNFAVRIHSHSSPQLLQKVADLHYHGVSSVSLMNDDICMQALAKRRFASEDLNNFAVTGCVDMCIPGKTGGEGFSSLLMCRTLDLALRNGNSKTLAGLIKDVGMKTGEVDSFQTFDDVLSAFFKQADYMIELIAKAAFIRDRLYAQYLPAPLISAFMQGCVSSRKDVTAGGAPYNVEGILFMSSIANTVDSLYVIKKLVFEQRKFTLRELVNAVDHNYGAGYENIHKAICELEGKWGNGSPEVDQLVRKMMNHLFEQTYKYTTYKGGVVAPFINSMTAHTYDGRISIATPDGRLAGKPFAASCNPYNVERHGPTGVLRSVSALDFAHVLGCAVNIRMHPSGIGQTPEARQKWINLIQTYFQMGGEQLQPTVVSSEVLRAAQHHPEQFENIIVKVGGYSAYFVDLGREIQDEIISRTEHDKI